MESLRVLRFCVLSLNVAIAACSSGSDDQSPACEPGRSVQCAGPAGCVGAQSCNADGSGYGPCSCGSTNSTATGHGTGGAGSIQTNPLNTSANYSTGGSPIQTGPTGGISSISTGGALAATGGSPAISTAACTAKSMAGYKYPNYVPARRMPGSCTEQDARQYHADCYLKGECSAFGVTGALAQCGACLTPSELSATSYGPLLRIGTPNAFFYQTNVPGCEELVGETACAPKMQVELLCEYIACADSCPLKDSSGYYDALYRCMGDARNSQCSQEQQAATCLTSTASAAACGGSSFEEQFIALAKVFCG